MIIYEQKNANSFLSVKNVPEFADGRWKIMELLKPWRLSKCHGQLSSSATGLPSSCCFNTINSILFPSPAGDNDLKLSVDSNASMNSFSALRSRSHFSKASITCLCFSSTAVELSSPINLTIGPLAPRNLSTVVVDMVESDLSAIRDESDEKNRRLAAESCFGDGEVLDTEMVSSSS